MATITFDTHAYIKKLKAVGVTEEQAKVQAETLVDFSFNFEESCSADESI